MTEIDYYLTPQSPWSYLGHARFAELVRRFDILVHVKACDLSRVFSVSGGLPLGQRALQRQSYRLIELRRYSALLNTPLNSHPKFFPVSGDAAARLILAAVEKATSVHALELAGVIGRAVWMEERDINDAATLRQLAEQCDLDGTELLLHSQTEVIAKRYLEVTEEAIQAEVFGAPTYIFQGERYWGQDRLDFLERALDGRPL